MLRNLTVTRKIVGSMVIVIAAYASIQLAYSARTQLQQLNDGLTQKGISMARLLSHQVVAAFEFNDLDAMKAAFRGAVQDPDFHLAAIHDAEGSLLVSSSQEVGNIEAHAVSSPQAQWRDNKLWVTAPIAPQGAAAGILTLALSENNLVAQRREVLSTTIVLGLLFMLGAGVVAFFVGSSLGRRLGKITEVAESVARGDLPETTFGTSSKDEIGSMATSFNAMTERFRMLAERVGEVAAGDLSSTTGLPGELAEAIDQMIVSQREMVKQITETAMQLNSAAEEFVANARQQEHGATTQSSSVEQTRRTMESLLASAREIGQTSQAVLQNAERTQQNSQVVAERIALLSSQTHRITEILEVIKDIANKSDLLALNAALEGTKAGDAGRGFSLVATQMQRLAENVMGSVRDIKELTATINEATQATVLSTEESTKLATDTTRSVRQIALIIQQQETGTEQVTKATNEVALIAAQSTQASKQIVTSAKSLLSLSEQLHGLVGRFRIGHAGPRLSADGEATPS